MYTNNDQDQVADSAMFVKDRAESELWTILDIYGHMLRAYSLQTYDK